MFLANLSTPRGLNHGRTSRGAYEHASVQNESRFVEDIEVARNPLVSQSNWKNVVDFPRPENTTTHSQAEDQFWRWVSLKIFTVHELKELRVDRPLSYVLDQLDLCIEFAHLIAKR
ncbi:ATP-binding cassette (ABC) Superfamily [Phytophthora palmivora]|uniref:ATP-binding cassette (ABC) Superfamily n=1 Tax=Phytophthora palmivora TaxID=4796 RepID=A0A2P4X7W2_9STRA|nr:ATP-binding cassette (ABC) Superfamily [Phytophthora palmivora]